MPAAGVRIAGHGYSVLPPSGEGWTLVRRGPDAAIFGKRRPEAQARRDDGPYLLLAGVQALPAERGDDFTIAARQWLIQRLQVPGRQLLTLNLYPSTWQGASCVQYQARQVDRYDFIEPRTRFEYDNSGRLCRHPYVSALWIQAFRNARSLRVEGSTVGWEEAQDFIDHVLLVAPEVERD